jgi:CubicO group peptidase (beta-lactamase class C family)
MTRTGRQALVLLGSGLLMGAATLARPAAAQEPFPGFDAYVTKAMADWKIPGLAIGVVRNDSVIYAKGYGVRKTGASEMVNDQTLFEIGSSSKSFTATLVAMHVTDGKMRWDDRLATHLPGFRLYDPVANAEVTLRDALSHRTGLSRGELSWFAAGGSRDDVLRRVRYLRPSSPFRTRWEYQNVMFLAAGEAAAKVAGTSWDELVRQRIFGPLQMTASLPALKPGQTMAALATPHQITRDTVYSKSHADMNNIAPAGSIVSNARDMAQYLRFQLGDGTFGGKRLVSAAALRETHTPQILMPAGGGGPPDSLTRFSTYGLGWMVHDYRGQLVWEHGGNTDGMTTAMGMLPDRKFGVVVLSNMHGAALPGILMRYLFDRELNAPMRDLSAEALARTAVQRRRADSVARAQESQRVAAGPPPLALSQYAGTYSDSLYGDAIVTVEGSRLVLKRAEFSGPLEHRGFNNFRWGPLPSAAVTELQVRFDVGPDGTVTGLSFAVGADVSSFVKQRPPPPRSGSDSR